MIDRTPPKPIPSGDLELARILREIPDFENEPGLIPDDDHVWTLDAAPFEVTSRNARIASARRRAR